MPHLPTRLSSTFSLLAQSSCAGCLAPDHAGWPTAHGSGQLGSARVIAREGAHHLPVGISTISKCFLVQNRDRLSDFNPALPLPQTKSGPSFRSTGSGGLGVSPLSISCFGAWPEHKGQGSPCPMKAKLTGGALPYVCYFPNLHSWLGRREHLLPWCGTDQRVPDILSPMGGTTVLDQLQITPHPHLTFEKRAPQTVGLPRPPAHSGHCPPFLT